MAYMKDSTGRRLDSFIGVSLSEAESLVTAGTRAAQLLAEIGAQRVPFPPVTTDVPSSVTHSTSATITAQVVSAQSPTITKLGNLGTWNETFGRLSVNNIAAMGFYIDVAEFEVNWFVGATNQPFWIWVDGLPATAAPDVDTLTASSTQWTKITFGSAKRRRIEFFSQGNNGWLGVNASVSAVIEPLTPLPRVALVGDSFFAGSDTTFTPMQLTAACVIGRSLGVDFHISATGGTGYVAGSPNQFGSAARIASVTGIPDLQLIILSGSVNDDASHASVQAAAETLYDAYASGAPGVPVVVFGPQPSNAVDTISTNRANSIAAVKAACAASPNVIGFYDMVGTENGAASAWSSGTTYSTGNRVSYKGAIYEAANGATTFSGGTHTPGTSRRWKVITWLYTGTGNSGATTGDGTRDAVLYSDNVHPSTAGSLAMGVRQATMVLAALKAIGS